METWYDTIIPIRIPRPKLLITTNDERMKSNIVMTAIDYKIIDYDDKINDQGGGNGGGGGNGDDDTLINYNPHNKIGQSNQTTKPFAAVDDSSSSSSSSKMNFKSST